jgi:hypothetical protein
MNHQAASDSLLPSFERHLRARNRSERTIGNYLESARLAACAGRSFEARLS